MRLAQVAVSGCSSSFVVFIKMSPAQKLRLFVTERLNEVLVEILEVIDKSIAEFEKEATLSREVIARQHALLCSLNKPLLGHPISGESEPDRFQRPSSDLIPL